jgi:hypothetical protein
MVQPVEKRLQIVMRAGWSVVHPPCPTLAHDQKPSASGPRIRELAVCFDEIGGRATPVKAPQQDRRCRLHHGPRGISKDIGQSHVRRVLAKTNRVRQIRVRMVINHEVRRAALATKPRVNALKNSLAARHRSFPVWAGSARSLHCFLRTGGACISFCASSISDNASFVPSIASSRVSR